MLLNYKIKNFKTFKNEIEISFIADMHIKKFLANIININNENILKSVGIYGPNNTGKSCLIEAVRVLRNVMLNEPHDEFYNSFYDEHITYIEVIYAINKNIYRYTVKYDSFTNLYLYEKLDKLNKDKTKKFVSEKIFIREGSVISIESLENKIPTNLSNSMPLFMMLDLKNSTLYQVQEDYIDFAKSINVINMDAPMSIRKTLELIQKDEKARKFIVSFAKNCDVNIEDLGYSSNVKSDIDINNKLSSYNNLLFDKEILKMWSKHHNQIVPSVLFDSMGTRKLISLAGYIYDALVNGGMLLVDELDSSLHHIIIRAIIALFNNGLNEKTQLMFSTHDALTMDLRRLFRKDQIYLTDINKEGNNIVVRLSKRFTARDKNGIRGDENIVDYYLKGRFGGIPTPDLFESLYDIIGDE